MKRIETHDPDLLEWRGGGGCLMLFGLPFLCAGLFVMSVPFTGIKVEGNTSPWFIIPFGSVFALVGGILMFGRRGVILDRRRKLATTWWGLLARLSTTDRILEDFTSVSLTKEIRRSDKSSTTVYPVRLTGVGKPINLGEPQDYNASRSTAEAVAKFLSLPVQDSTSGQVVRRDAGTLDESVRDRMRRTGEKVEVPATPEGLRSHVTPHGDSTVLEIPALGFTKIHGILMLLGLAFPAFIFFFFLRPFFAGDDGGLMAWIFPVVLGAFFVVGPMVFLGGRVLSSARLSWRVTVSPSSLKIDRRGVMGVKTLDLAASEVEELEINALPGEALKFAGTFRSGAGILVRTDRTTVSFGGHLPESELRYLHAVIKSAMAS